MPQVMKPEILDSGTLQGRIPCVGRHLLHRVAFVGENVLRVLALPFFQNRQRRLVQCVAVRLC